MGGIFRARRPSHQNKLIAPRCLAAIPPVLARPLRRPCLQPPADSQRPPTGESPFFEELPTVLSTSCASPRSSTRPGHVTILDRDFIQRHRLPRRRPPAAWCRACRSARGGPRPVGHLPRPGQRHPTEIQVLDRRAARCMRPAPSAGRLGRSCPHRRGDRAHRGRPRHQLQRLRRQRLPGVINIITRHSQQDRAAGRSDQPCRQPWHRRHPGKLERQRRPGCASAVGPATAASAASARFTCQPDPQPAQRLPPGRLQKTHPAAPAGNKMARRAGLSDHLRQQRPPGSPARLHLTWRTHRGGRGMAGSASTPNRESRHDRWLAMGCQRALPSTANRAGTRTNAELQHRLPQPPGNAAGGAWKRGANRTPTSCSPATRRPRLYRAFSTSTGADARPGSSTPAALVEKNGAAAPQFIPRAFRNWRPAPPTPSGPGCPRPGSSATCSSMYGDVRAYDPGRAGALPSPGPTANPQPAAPTWTPWSWAIWGFPSIDATLDVRFSERISDFVIRHPASPGSPLPCRPPSSSWLRPVVLRGCRVPASHPAARRRLLFQPHLIDRRTGRARDRQAHPPYVASLTWLQDYPAGWTSTASLLRMGRLAGSWLRAGLRLPPPALHPSTCASPGFSGLDGRRGRGGL